ncbi:unnamed protein product [Urochloa decumbens]|uniref:Uncharacterized protein n=1 Tax=Urochloa decumbens TaxID=240449 RepID=A0ABC9GZ37_9POAL
MKVLKGKSLKRNGSIDNLTSPKKNKRTYLTRSSTKNKTILNEGGTTELLISGDLHLEPNQGFWSELSEETASNLSESVVSLALSNGRKVLFTCSGIAVQREGYVTRFLTSASLAKAFIDEKEHHDNLKVEVRHEDNVVIGFLGEYDVDCNIASVNVQNFPDVQTVVFMNLLEFPPHVNVVAVGCDISGKLITTTGELNCLSGSVPTVMTATCKISKVCEGGPLFDCDGNFLGMNLSFSTEGTLFMPKVRLLEKFWQCCTSLEEVKFPKEVRSCILMFRSILRFVVFMLMFFYRVEESSNVHQDLLNEYGNGNLGSLGYPEPPKSMLNDGVILANNFEEPFGDICGRGVWSELREAVASNIHGNIVALASFNGEKRFFACTGCLIEWNGCTTILTAASLIRDSYLANKIVENLRIEVLLPNKELAEGTLQHYNLHYNIALVSVNDLCATQPLKIQHRWRDNRELLAVGRIFKSGKLMAARGLQFSTVVTHDCKFLGYTTCAITKAGIGGPLLDFDGKFAGMNFYDKYAGGTPFLSWDAILHVLEPFKTKRTVADAGHDGYASHLLDWTIDGDHSVKFNRWFVPLPFWSRPDDLERYDCEMRSRRPKFVQCVIGGTQVLV